jgi:hypothetical protein
VAGRALRTDHRDPTTTAHAIAARICCADQGDPDATLDLQAALATAYNNGCYGAVIDYRRAPPPPLLSDDQLAWLHQILIAAGLR